MVILSLAEAADVLQTSEGSNRGIAAKFCDEQQVAQRLRPYAWQRTKVALHALTTGTTHYLTNGTVVLS